MGDVKSISLAAEAQTAVDKKALMTDGESRERRGEERILLKWERERPEGVKAAFDVML